MPPLARRGAFLAEAGIKIQARSHSPRPSESLYTCSAISIIGETNLATLIERHAWKENFDDLREVLRVCRGLYEGGKTQAAGAELIGLSTAALSERLKRWGVKWPPVEAPPPR